MSDPLSQKLKEIAKLLDLPRPPLVVVVGAGVSIGATELPQASWLGLLKHGINHLVQRQFQQQWGTQLEASLEASFFPFKLENALQHAELVEQALNTPDATAFTDWLTSAFSSFRAKNERRDVLEALRDLQEAGALLLTTNYDDLLNGITNSPPVTWEEHSEFLRVITRQRPGVLHIHGHWRCPSSIVLGRSSYERVVADEDFQQLFRTLWLEYSWLYVGCGDGLDDPNLGRLLEWGKRWGESAMPDYFLAREDKAAEIDDRAEKPKNLETIGYPSYGDLAQLLHSVTPSARSWPFVRIDEQFSLFRVPGSNIPFPSRQEYLNGDVPVLVEDAEVRERLVSHGWACILDLASVGKTTLALRLATAPEQRELPVFYFDFKTEILDAIEAGPGAALHRLLRPGTLLILDNIHHQPEIARRLWEQWKANPRDSRMLLIATRMQRQVITAPEQDLSFFENHPGNRAIVLKPGPEDLGRIAKEIYRRVGGDSGPTMPEPPKEALAAWYRDFRAALNAFTFAVMARLPDLQDGEWELPPAAAAAWVRQRWLKQLSKPEHENVICLAAFGAQELELLVPETALPYPEHTAEMLKLGLIARTDEGRFGQFHRFGLREPGWGRLILAALELPRDIESILLVAAPRHPTLALTFGLRLKAENLTDLRGRLWRSLSASREILGSNLLLANVPLSHVGLLLQEAGTSGQHSLTSFLWQTIESKPEALAARALESQLEEIRPFLEVAKRQGRDTKALWQAIESNPEEFAARAWKTPLDYLGSFLKFAMRENRDPKPLWDAIESRPDTLATRVWETPLHDIASFFEVAQQQGRTVERLWKMLENEPDRLSQKGIQASLDGLVGFAHRAPATLLEVALREIKPGHWNSMPLTKSMVGATWLAWNCIKAGRTDLASDLIDLLIRRANWIDFPPQAGGFIQVCWLLGNVSLGAAVLIDPFLTNVVSEKWLRTAYMTTTCGQIASGLRQLALHQSMELCQRFHHRGLGGRLYKELEQFESADAPLKSAIMQMLGSAGLCGWAVSSQSLTNLKLETVANLPATIQPHRTEATRVEDWQLQLWLGLRVFVSVRKITLPMSQYVIEQTLALWRENLTENLEPTSVLSKLNQSMVAWLETCLKANPVALMPSREPLWTFVGFPVRLNLPER